MKTLHLLSKHDGELLLHLEWDGEARIVGGTPRMQKAATRWIRQGLRELVGPMGSVEPRHTEATEPEWLPRVRDYLEGYSVSFRVEYVSV